MLKVGRDQCEAGRDKDLWHLVSVSPVEHSQNQTRFGYANLCLLGFIISGCELV